MKRYFLSAVALTTMMGTALADNHQKEAVMYKPLQCGCCDDYAEYLEDNGFKVEIKSLPSSQLNGVKKMAGVPEGFEGCHTLMVHGYVIDGLVPIKTVNKLLTEKPEIKGITLPGMPSGTPGMPGKKAGPLVIYELSGPDNKVYAVE